MEEVREMEEINRGRESQSIKECADAQTMDSDRKTDNPTMTLKPTDMTILNVTATCHRRGNFNHVFYLTLVLS